MDVCVQQMNGELDKEIEVAVRTSQIGTTATGTYIHCTCVLSKPFCIKYSYSYGIQYIGIGLFSLMSCLIQLPQHLTINLIHLHSHSHLESWHLSQCVAILKSLMTY